ncbi:MAG: hypothetical protein H6737_06795 [Alphaproteobacteria bacterium]|nr:hypothetical protein [Alphaproteobacteria bacterium]
MSLIVLMATALGSELGGFALQQEGYLDVGWFDAQGDGVSYEWDVRNRVLGEGPNGAFTEVPRAYFGDPWANMVNSQGSSADLGLGRTGLPRFDPIQSHGNPTFLVNRFHHEIAVDQGEQLGVRAGLNVEPRSGFLGSPGDVIAVDTAYVVWRPMRDSDLKLYAGRLESGFGREYRYRHASARMGITPSIVARYLIGLQTGLRVRGTYRRWLGYSVAVTNGSSTTEEFGHLNNDLDVNGIPTGTVRVGALMRRPVRLEVGASGQVGPQDGQPDPGVIGWQVGVDGRLDAGRLTVEVEGVISHQPGDGSPKSERLDARGGYVTVEVRPIVQLGVYGRVDWRDADLVAWPNLYVSNVLRLTGGAHVDLSRAIAVKAEYLHLAELMAGTSIRDDVLTTSLVFRYETRKMEL